MPKLPETKYDLFVAWCNGYGRGEGKHYQAIEATERFDQWLLEQSWNHGTNALEQMQKVSGKKKD